MLNKLLLVFAILLIPTTAFAISVPWNRPSVGTVNPLYTGDGIGVYASSTIGNGTVTGGLTVSGTATTTNLIITSVTGTQCLRATSGLVSGIGSDCGSGTVSTSTNETSGFLSYWTSNSATPALLGKVATSTGSCTGLSSCSGFSVVGGVAAVIATLYDAFTHPAAGQSATTSLMLFNGQASSTAFSTRLFWAGGTATTSISAAGLLTIGNITGSTQCLHTDTNGVVSGTGSDCGAGGGGGDSFTHTTSTNSATTTFLGIGSTTPFSQLSVSTPAQQAATFSLFGVASTTNASLFNVLGNGNVGIGTTSPMDNLSVSGNIQAWGNGFQHFGSVPSADTAYCTTGKKCFFYGGSDNTLSGIGYEVYNQSNGASAYSFYQLNNDLTDATGLNYAGLFLNSSKYNDATYGTGENIPNGLQILNSMGPTLAINSATTSANNYFSFAFNGTALANQVARFTPLGLGVGTTSPNWGASFATSTKVVTSTNGTAAFSVENASATNIFQVDTLNSANAIFSVASSTLTTYFGIDRFGHQFTDGKSPALTNCGTGGGTAITGDDNSFEITTGLVTQNGCTATFGNAWTNAPVCTVTEQGGSVVNPFNYTISTTAIVITQTGIVSDKIDVLCRQPNNSNAN